MMGGWKGAGRWCQLGWSGGNRQIGDRVVTGAGKGWPGRAHGGGMNIQDCSRFGDDRLEISKVGATMMCPEPKAPILLFTGDQCYSAR